MNTSQLNSQLRLYKCFIGTFACDQLPKQVIAKRPFALIMNTDPITKPGQHWVALYVDKNNVANYFDSYGLPPLNNEFYDFIDGQTIDSLIYNTKLIQGITSDTCGNYCVMFIKLRCLNIGYEELIQLDFNDNNIRKVI